MREIVFDTETTGLNPAGGDRMVEIGCVEIFNRIETGRTFHAYFNPDRVMPTDAELVCGLTNILSASRAFRERAWTSCSSSSRIPRWWRTTRASISGFTNFEARAVRPFACA